MIDPLRLSFTVACDAEHAFSTWTGRVSLWWPADHTVTQESDVKVMIEPGVGGRIFERTGSGREIDWGWVTVWEPPGRLAYQWHLGTEPHHATEVEVTFQDRPDGTTQVDIEHRGWDTFGAQAEPRRQGNRAGWADIRPHFTAACAAAAAAAAAAVAQAQAIPASDP